MKKIFTLVSFLISGSAAAQWSDLTNLFTDSLHMAVCTATQEQVHPIVLRSYPDGGYFLIWEDSRNMATTNTDIYAQKYDGFGKRLWAINGVPVANGPNAQHYFFSANTDYRNRSYAATDSANGFFICYTDDSISTYDWQRMAIQHVRSDGSMVFPGAGNIVAATASGQTNNFSMPMLIADGMKGCFLSYKNSSTQDAIYIYDFQDNNGVLTNTGGGRMTDDAVQQSRLSVCDVQYYLDFPGVTVYDFNIWPDGQAGCNVVMDLYGNGDGQGYMLGYNRIWRAKKTSVSKTYHRGSNGFPCPLADTFKQGQVYPLYTEKFDEVETYCGTVGGQEAYVVTSMILQSNGFRIIDNSSYDYNYPKGVLLNTKGNINVNLIAVDHRTLTGNTVSDFTVAGYGMPEEVFDSIPYERTSFSNPGLGDNPTPPKSMNALAPFRDTLLGSGDSYPDFSMAANGTDIFLASLMGPSGGNRLVRLQHLSVTSPSAGTFSLDHLTPQMGTVIGSELNTGFTSTELHYDLPMFALSNDGYNLFYVRDLNRGTARVSPIFKDAQLSWGAMGAPIGSGYYNGSFYDLINPVAVINETGQAVIGWMDDKNIPGTTGNNIFMRHLDTLYDESYQPPVVPLQPIKFYSPQSAHPIVLTGSSKAYSVITAPLGDGNSAPVAEILDDNNLGNVQVSVEDFTGGVRYYDGTPYMDRDYTIVVQNSPGGAQIHVRLFFTTKEFTDLQAADPQIKSPGDLVVIKQGATSNIAPDSYIPEAGEKIIVPISWGIINGGYYIEIIVTEFSNFFIKRGSSPLPVTWLGIQAIWADLHDAKISWQVADQVNVKDYTVQQSADGTHFTDVRTVTATAETNYTSTIPADATIRNYYRVLQRDLDNRFSFSNTVSLARNAQVPLGIYPNPATDKLYIKGLAGYNYIQVSNAHGQIMQQITVTPGMLFINISTYSSGLYIFTATGEKDSQTLKFVKQ